MRADGVALPADQAVPSEIVRSTLKPGTPALGLFVVSARERARCATIRRAARSSRRAIFWRLFHWQLRDFAVRAGCAVAIVVFRFAVRAALVCGRGTVASSRSSTRACNPRGASKTRRCPFVVTSTGAAARCDIIASPTSLSEEVNHAITIDTQLTPNEDSWYKQRKKMQMGGGLAGDGTHVPVFEVARRVVLAARRASGRQGRSPLFDRVRSACSRVQRPIGGGATFVCAGESQAHFLSVQANHPPWARCLSVQANHFPAPLPPAPPQGLRGPRRAAAVLRPLPRALRDQCDRIRRDEPDLQRLAQLHQVEPVALHLPRHERQRERARAALRPLRRILRDRTRRGGRGVTHRERRAREGAR